MENACYRAQYLQNFFYIDILLYPFPCNNIQRSIKANTSVSIFTTTTPVYQGLNNSLCCISLYIYAVITIYYVDLWPFKRHCSQHNLVIIIFFLFCLFNQLVKQVVYKNILHNSSSTKIYNTILFASIQSLWLSFLKN